MKQARSSRAVVPASFFVRLMLPFAAPIAMTLVLLVFVGERWPRSIAPGSGLKLAGLGAAVLAAALAWRFAVRGIADRRVHRFAALLCLVTGLMGWPVWTMGLLPSLNGVRLEDERTVPMMLERTETTRESKTGRLFHWAWLRADAAEGPAGSGRYFIPAEVHADWSRRPPGPVRIQVARGFLGAEVVTGFE